MCRLFREHTGQTLAGYAMEMKMERAKELLRDDRYNMTQISGKLSFENPQYFARVFKRECGMTPTEWRQLANK